MTRRYRRIWLGFDGGLVVALGIVCLIAFRLGGLLAASGLAFLVLLIYRYLPTVRSAGRIVLHTPRSPATVREALADHRSPLIAVNAVGADRIERTGEDETTIVTGGERIVYATERNAEGVAFETSSDGDPVVRGTARVEAREGGSWIEIEYERPARFRLRDLLHLPLLEWYERRLWRHLDYEVEADEGGLRL